jgi:hypothetical protein
MRGKIQVPATGFRAQARTTRVDRRYPEMVYAGLLFEVRSTGYSLAVANM